MNFLLKYVCLWIFNMLTMRRYELLKTMPKLTKLPKRNDGRRHITSGTTRAFIEKKTTLFCERPEVFWMHYIKHFYFHINCVAQFFFSA